MRRSPLERAERLMFCYQGNHSLSFADNQLDILLAEDDYSDTLLIIKALNSTKQPFRLCRVMRGDNVLPYMIEAAQSSLPNLLLLDLGLPHMDGFEVLEKLAAAPAAVRSVPLVILTGYKGFESLPKAYNTALPIYGYLPKPARVDQIQPILSRLPLPYAQTKV